MFVFVDERQTAWRGTECPIGVDGRLGSIIDMVNYSINVSVYQTCIGVGTSIIILADRAPNGSFLIRHRMMTPETTQISYGRTRSR